MTEKQGVNVSLEQLREILGDEYLANRPSYDRAAARVKKKSGIDMSREDFDLLKRGLRNLEELLNEGKVDRTKFKVRKYTVNSWGKHGDHYQVKAHLVPIEEEPLAQIQPAPYNPPKISNKARQTGMEVLIIPDLHVGYRRAKNAMLPLHDERCLSLYLQVAKAFQPEHIVLVGDNLDLPALSRFLTPVDLKYLIQPAIDRLGQFYRDLREAAPRASVKVIEGNHEKRINTSLLTMLPELYGIARAGEEEPVLAVPYLLHFDKLGFEYVAPYGKATYVNGVRFEHGSLHGRRGGDSVSKLLDKYRRCIVTGHVHRLELAFETIHEEVGAFIVFAMSVGTGALLDGTVPGPEEPNWQNGFGTIWRGNQPQIHLINNGHCIVGAREFEAQHE